MYKTVLQYVIFLEVWFPETKFMTWEYVGVINAAINFFRHEVRGHPVKPQNLDSSKQHNPSLGQVKLAPIKNDYEENFGHELLRKINVSLHVWI